MSPGSSGGLLQAPHARENAEQVLHVMADLVRNHVALCELATPAGAGAEFGLQLAEE